MRAYLLLVPALLLATGPARAQPSGASTAAQLLFDEAKALSKKGDLAAACPKFVESNKLEPAGGTILHAADCHQRQGKLATAWGEYNEALSFAIRDKRADREQIAREQIALLGPQLGKVLLVVPSDAREIEALTVSIDGTTIGRAGWGSPVPLDEGTHVVTASAPGYRPRRMELSVTNGVLTTFAVVAPEKEDTPIPTPPDVPKLTPANSTDERQRTIALAVGGIGLIALGVGAGFGIRAISIGDQSSRCTEGPPGRNGCSREVVDEQNTARTSAAISTVAFVAGAVVVGAAAVLWFTAPKAAARTGVALGPIATGAGITLRGEL